MQEWPFITYSKRNVLPPELWADPCGKEPVPSGCKNLQFFPLKHPLGVPKNLQNRCLSCSFTSLQSHKHIFFNEWKQSSSVHRGREETCVFCVFSFQMLLSILLFVTYPCFKLHCNKKAYITMQKRRMGRIGILVDRSFCFQANRKNVMNTCICGFSFLWTETLWTNH